MKLKCIFLVLVAIVGLTVFAVNPTDRLCCYKEKVQSKDSGVYEYDGDLYVHVRKPVKGSMSQMRIRMKAISEMNDLLRRWVVDYVRTNRVDSSEESTTGISIAAAVLDNANPLWRYGEWKCRAKVQEFTGSKDGYFWICQVFDKGSVIQQIPEDYYKAVPSTNAVFSALSTLLPIMLKSDSARVYTELCANDLHVVSNVDVLATGDFGRFREAFEIYKASKRYCDIERSCQRLLSSEEEISWVDVPSSPVEQRFENVKFETNTVSLVNVVTNYCDRAETDEECNRLGISANRKMRDEMRVTEESIIVETKTETVVTTRKTIRKKRVKVVRGDPRFEQIFLSGGILANVPSAQIASGVDAAKKFFSPEATLDEREKVIRFALCENPGDIQLWNMYGRCLIKRQEPVGALICFRAAANLDKNDQFMLANLSEAYELIGCHRLACAYAVLGVGLSKDDWCLRKCKEILVK